MKSNYAKKVYEENVDVYKLLIEAKVEHHYYLHMICQHIHNDPNAKNMYDIVNRELAYSRSDGYCIHPKEYQHKVGSFTKCGCCKKIIL
jgi:hypothetical protein